MDAQFPPLTPGDAGYLRIKPDKGSTQALSILLLAELLKVGVHERRGGGG